MSTPAIEAARRTHAHLELRKRLILLEHITGKSVPQLIVEKAALSRSEERKLEELLGRLEAGTPAQILTGRAAFLDFEVKVKPGVFIPRPETEELVERTLERLGCEPRLIVEIGTGTGAVAIALARRFPSSVVLATDVCGTALELARENAADLGLAARIRFISADLFEFPEADELKGRVELLISNPPYIPTSLLASLPDEVRLFDPPKALDGGADGFRTVAKILDEAARFLHPRGLAALEIDPLLERVLKRYMSTSSLRFSTEVDTRGNLRFLFVRR